MKGQNLDSPFPQVISDPQAAALLTDPANQRFLWPFIARECTVSQAARELGVSVNSLLYRVNQMVRLGLLKVVRQQARPGRAVNVYRSRADVFFVPFELTPSESLEALFVSAGNYWQSLLVRNLVQSIKNITPQVAGFQIWRGESGEVYSKPATQAGHLLDFMSPNLPPMLAFWSLELWLDPADSRALRDDLLEVYYRYAGLKGKERYSIHLAMAPWVLQEEAGFVE